METAKMNAERSASSGTSQAWGISLLIHGFAVCAAIWLVAKIEPVVPHQPFRWEVSLIPQPTPAVAQEPKASPATSVREKMLPRPAPAVVEVQRQEAAEVPPIETRTVIQSRPAPVHRIPDTSVTHEVKTSPPDEPVEQAVQSSSAAKTVEQMERIAAQNGEVVAERPLVSRETAAISSPEAVEQERVASVAAYVPIQREAPSVRPAPIQEVKVRPHVMAPGESMAPQAPPSQSPVTQTVPVHTGPTARADYGWLKDLLARRIKDVKRYPQPARLHHLEGKVVVHAVISEDGNLTDVRIHESSGHDILDKAALETMREACPLYLSHPLGRSQVALRIPIHYTLSD